MHTVEFAQCDLVYLCRALKDGILMWHIMVLKYIID